MQQGLAQWQTFLADKQLPVLQRTKKDVQALIDQAQLSIMQYAGPIVYDAGLSTCLFRHVNTQREAANKNPLTTLGNVLSHLGQSSFQTFLNKAPLLESLNLPEKNIEGYMRVMGHACHAALQATQWAVQRNVVETEETQLAALLQNTAELMLWCHGGDVMPKIEELCYVKKQSYEQASNSVLGCGMRELGGALASQWHLPEMATAGLLTRQNDFTLATGVSLAAELSRIVALNWYGKDATDIILRIAKHKGKAEGEIEHVLHLNAVNINDVLLDRGYDSPAKTLFLLPDDNYSYPQFVFESESPDTEKQTTDVKSQVKEQVKPEKNTVDSRKALVEKIKARKLAEEKNNRDTAKNKTKSILNSPKIKEESKPVKSIKKNPQLEENVPKKTSPEKISPSKNKPSQVSSGAGKPKVSKELAAAIKEFQLMVVQAKPAHDLIEHAVKTCLLCGVQRCVFVVKLPNKDLLVSRYAAQVSEDIAINSLKIPINKPHVFSLLMEKSRNLFLNNTNAGKYWNFIPEPVKLAIGVRSFFAMSIFVNNHAMGLMYADKVKGELTQAEFTQFQGVCRLLSKGIIQSAHNKKK